MIIKPSPANIGEIWSRYGKFYVVTGIEFVNRNWHITLTRVKKDLTSMGNRVRYTHDGLIYMNYKPASDTERLLFLHKELDNGQKDGR